MFSPRRSPHPNAALAALRLAPLLIALLVSACGPSEADLRSELREIDGELTAIRIAMNHHRSQMSQSEVEAFFGSFAVGYGATSGDYGLAGNGAQVASSAMRQYDVSSYSLEQLQSRFLELGKRRMAIAAKLD